MAKKIKSMLAGMLALVMLSTVALPALAEVDIPTTKTDWLGNGMQVNVKPGTDGYTYMIVADKDNGSVKKNFYYYETSNHTITKEVTGGGAVHLIPIVDTNKVYVTIYATIEGEVCHLRIDCFIDGVFNKNRDFCFIGESIGDIHSPCGVSAIMMCKLVAVDIYVSRSICASKFKIVQVSLRKVSFCKLLLIEARSTEVVVATVKSVLCIPSVGQIECYAVLTCNVCCIFDKQPIFIEIDYFSHIFSSKYQSYL